MGDIPALSEYYSGKPVHQLAALRLIWPNRVDVLLIVLRQLISFGYTLETTLEITAAEKIIMQAANKDLGWEEEEDWKLKRRIYEALDDQVIKKQWSLSDLLSLPRLQSIFHQNENFRILDSRLLQMTRATRKWKLVDGPPQPDLTPYDGAKTIPDYLDQLFHRTITNEYVKQPFTKSPKFISIRYTSQGKVPFKQLRRFEFLAPAIREGREGKLGTGRDKATYHLCAIVRLGKTGETSAIRTYWKDCSEIIPAQVGHFENKEFDVRFKDRWSVEHPGSFILYYYRIFQPDGWPSEELIDEAKEYEERPWVLRQLKGVDSQSTESVSQDVSSTDGGPSVFQ